MGISIKGKSELELQKVFLTAYKRSFTKSVEYIFAKCFEYAPVGKTRKGSVNLRNAIMYDFNWANNEAFIGLPRGSEMEKIAFYTEMGCFFNPYYDILTKEGKKQFKDLTENDFVLTHKLRWRKIQKIHKVPIKKVVEQAFVTFENNKKIITTLDHPYLVERNGEDLWIKAKDLKEGDIVYKVKFIYNNTKKVREEISIRMINRIISKEKKIQFKDGYIISVEKIKVKNIKIKKPFFHSKNKVLYNLTIEDDNSFILNSIITHNTGERGSKGWTQFFNEKKPVFTIPIVPLKAKAMHFVTESGKDIFMKTSKGQKPQSYMRRAFKDSEQIVEKIWKKEFSNQKIKSLLKRVKFGN